MNDEDKLELDELRELVNLVTTQEMSDSGPSFILPQLLPVAAWTLRELEKS